MGSGLQTVGYDSLECLSKLSEFVFALGQGLSYFVSL